MESIGELLRRTRIPTATSAASTSTSTDKPDCSICHGAGYLRVDVPVDDARFGDLVPCQCTAQEQAERRRARLFERSNLGPLRGKTFDNFVIHRRVRPERNSPEAAHNAALTFARRPDRSEVDRLDRIEIEWLVLLGNHGTGKTHLAAAVANYRLEQGRPAVFIVVPDLLDRLRAAYSPSSEVSYDELFETARETELLILDDLGAQSSTPWAQEKLYQIINERYNWRLPTVITSNLSLDGMELRLRSRIGDKSLADIRVIHGDDVRLGMEYSPAKEAPRAARTRPSRT